MTTATIEASNEPTTSRTDKQQPLLPFRGDTLLGVCEAIGQELGFNPTWLRVAFAALLLWNPEVIVAAYLGLGVVVATTRWLLADRVPTAATRQDDVTADFAKDEEELLAA